VARNLIPFSSAPVLLSVKDATTGELLLDTTFIPQKNNNFNILADNTLGIRQFIASSSSNPVDDQHWRVQFFHKIRKNGIPQTVTLKLYKDEGGNATIFSELPIIMENVKYGELSAEADVPRTTFLNQFGFEMDNDIYVKAFDAATGELLVDIVPFATSLINYLFYSGTAKHYVVPLPATEDTSTGMLYWDWFSEVYEL
jgi:hypothetical protein